MSERLGGRLSGDWCRLDHDMAELSLLVPRWQVEALEKAARGHGLTAGQMLRRLIGGFCATLPAPE